MGTPTRDGQGPSDPERHDADPLDAAHRTVTEPAHSPTLLALWRNWAFGPVDTATMAVLRILCGLLTIGWSVSYLPDASAFLANDGLISTPSDGDQGWWSLNVPAPHLMLVLMALAGLALVVGWHARLASVAVAFGMIWLQRRDVYVLNSGDLLLREFAILLALMPSGELWSLDARRRRRRARRKAAEDSPPAAASRFRAPWGLRLLQLQISLLYLVSVTDKLQGRPWDNGTAVGEAVQLEDLQRIHVPQPIATSMFFSGPATWITLVVEASLVIGMWFAATRYWVMLAGVAIHLGIEGTLLIGWFSLTIISCYVAFIPPADIRRAGRWARRRWRERGSASPGRDLVTDIAV